MLIGHLLGYNCILQHLCFPVYCCRNENAKHTGRKYDSIDVNACSESNHGCLFDKSFNN